VTLDETSLIKLGGDTKNKNNKMDVENNMLMFRYKLKGIIKNVNKLEGDFRKFKMKEIDNIDKMNFMMYKLVKNEQN
jgi:hypothetical protein